MQKVLTVEHVEGGYGDRQVLHDVSLDISLGERLLLVGPNGCGKTTLLKIVAGALQATRGRIIFLETDVSNEPTHERVKNGIGYLMQTHNVFPSLSVEENLHLSFWRGKGVFQAQRDWLLDIFPMLKDKLLRRAGLLSGGERQALAVAMVVMHPVKLLLLDEPTAGLSPKAAEEILIAVQRAQVALGFSSIMVEHNLRVVTPWVSRVVLMQQGSLVAAESDPKRLLDRDWLQRYYFK